MPKLKVGGMEVDVPAGATVLEAREAARPIQGLLRHFRPEIERRIAEKRGAAEVLAEAAE